MPRKIRQKINPDNITTFLGVILSSLVAININYIKLFKGDEVELGKMVGAIIIGLNGWLTNRQKL